MEASQCLCHQVTPPFVGKGYNVTFCFMFLIMKSLKKIDVFLSQILIK
jgi:hypothetical protein